MISEAQRAERRTGLGGSDIAGIIPKPGTKTGVISPFTTPAQVWESKTNPGAESKMETEPMWWGSAEEDLVARRFSQLTGKRVVNHNFTIHDGCLLANLDRLIVPEGAKVAAHHGEIRTNELFEAKTSSCAWSPADVVETLPNGCEVLDGEAGIPDYYLTQCLHYMGRVPTAEKIYVAVKAAIPIGAFSRTEFNIYVLKRDDDIIRAQDEFARAWWEAFVIGGKKPEPVCEDDCKVLWRRSTPKTWVTLSDVAFGAWQALRVAQQQAKAAKDAEAQAKTALKAIMGSNEALLGPDGKTELATWKSASDSEIITVDWEGLAKSLNPTESEIAAVTTTWESLAKAKGATDEQIASFTTRTVKPGARKFLPKFTAKVVSYAESIDVSTLPQLPAPVATENNVHSEAKVAAA